MGNLRSGSKIMIHLKVVGECDGGGLADCTKVVLYGETAVTVHREVVLNQEFDRLLLGHHR